MDLNRTKPLTDLERHQEGRIVAVCVETPDEMRSLTQAGVMPGAQICVMHADSWHVLFFVDNTELAVDLKIASSILVEIRPMTNVQSVS